MSGLPTININFTQQATTLIERSERGTAVLIVKDETSSCPKFAAYQSINEINKNNYTSDNYMAICDCMYFAPYKCVVFSVDQECENLTETFNLIKQKVKNGWICIVDATVSEHTTLVSWIKARVNDGKNYKAVVYNNPADEKHIVNFTTMLITFNDNRGTQDGNKYIPSLVGILAKCNVQHGVTAFECTNLLSCGESIDKENEIKNGHLILENDLDSVKIVSGINSLTTLNGNTLTEDMQYIEIVEAMDIIADDIKDVFADTYKGKYKNNLDNQMLLIASINNYFKQLERELILDNNYYNSVEIDVQAQKEAWLGVGKDVSNWSDAMVMQNSFKKTVFLKADIKILGSMDSLTFNVNLF